MFDQKIAPLYFFRNCPRTAIKIKTPTKTFSTTTGLPGQNFSQVTAWAYVGELTRADLVDAATLKSIENTLLNQARRVILFEQPEPTDVIEIGGADYRITSQKKESGLTVLIVAPLG